MDRSRPSRLPLALAALLLQASAAVVPLVHEAAGAHGSPATSASSAPAGTSATVEAGCPPGCHEPGHHHRGHDPATCAVCHSVAPAAPTRIAPLAPRELVACGLAPRTAWSPCSRPDAPGVPRGPPLT